MEIAGHRGSKAENMVEAMKKLDAKLVAYLAAEDIPLPMPLLIKNETIDAIECLQKTETVAAAINTLSLKEEGDVKLEADFRAQKLELFKSICAIKLHLEALTLETEGAKRMELLSNEIRPIFTVESQLSIELIKNVPRYDMFHIMQFESEKYQSLTQCTRFGQEAQRDVKLSFDNADVVADADKPNFGRIHFAVWWREPGTCLNEMLGTGVLELCELYHASLLEQCKCIKINRRGITLASLYLKISLQLQQQQQPKSDINRSAEIKENCSIKLCNGGCVDVGGGGGGSSSVGVEDICGNEEQQLQLCSNTNNNTPNLLESSSLSSFNSVASTSKNKNNNNNNNKPQLDMSDITGETSKVRLLKGFIYVNETRNLLEPNTNCDFYLVCRQFWNDDSIVSVKLDDNSFKYQEQFAVINDEKFLKRVDKQQLQLEIWQRLQINDKDCNGNGAAPQITPIGIMRLPLHQFFIAYRDANITNHLCKGKLPVISIDAWAPIIRCDNNEVNGEVKCLLAIGSEQQIAQLKAARGFALNEIRIDSTTIDKKMFTKIPIAAATNDDNETQNVNNRSKLISAVTSSTSKVEQHMKSNDLLDLLDKALKYQPAAPPPPVPPTVEVAVEATTSANVAENTVETNKCFKFLLEIQRGTNLPLNPAAKGKKSSKRNASKRFPPNEAPSAYVTFQADESDGKIYKSHEGAVFATTVVEKSTQPIWQQHFRVAASIDYLLNSQKRFILKIWKRAANISTQNRLLPAPLHDAIIGFAALDLSVFLQDLHIGGFFNIVDFNGRINGQLEVRCQPLEDVHKLLQPSSVDAVIDQFENSLDLTHLNLGQAIKRKFTELEDISQRLRSRLVNITGQEFAPQFDYSSLENWQPFEAVTNVTNNNNDDDDVDLFDFERDINTPPPTSLSAQNVEVTQMISTPSKISTAIVDDDDSPKE